MTGATLARINGGRLKIGNQAVASMQTFVQDACWQAEAGGILIGRHIVDTPDVVVDSVTIPMPGDSRGRWWFYRHGRGHQQEMDNAWRESCGTCTYLGEWHTHPQPLPSPSCIDMYGWRRKLNAGDYEGDSLFFLIVGTQAVRVWEGEAISLHFARIGEFNLLRKHV